MAIGQKLEEARNRKGISLREATESTKIRGDYLSAFESGNFDINLPEVYLRGFVRLYARFLDLDQEAVLADLDLELGNVKNKSSRISLGSITGGESEVDQSKSTITSKKITANQVVDLKKITLIISFILIVGVISLLLIIDWSDEKINEESLIDNETDTSINEVLRDGTANSSLITNDDLDGDDDTFKLSLFATGPIELLIIDDLGQGAPVDFKDLEKGWMYDLKIEGSFRCHCSSLENLRFTINDGKQKKIDGVGAGNFSWQPQ